ncbi:alpha/beta hydrolase [Actinokineospora inagensis]|uniref:alpha/beta hydrolase n=1 Tax=Actinokineospora inagensis TaxID=103730 RepID=UPI000414C790|nr:alpha/beta hydrolase [Actinokineospora inagensis]
MTSAIPALDHAYLPGRSVPSVQPYLDEYATRSAAARATLPWRELPHQTHYFPAAPDAPLVVFVHGGYWQLLDERDSAYPAGGLVGAGIAFAAIGYPLSPAASVGEITSSVVESLWHLVSSADQVGFDPGRIVLVGHSVGAQLAGMALADGFPAIGAVLLSGLYELGPLRRTTIGAEVGLTEDEVARCGPARSLRPGWPPLVLVRGDDEPVGFAEQQSVFGARARAVGVSVTDVVVSGRNHFDLPLGLGDPADPVGSLVHALARSC